MGCLGEKNRIDVRVKADSLFRTVTAEVFPVVHDAFFQQRASTINAS